MSDDVKFPQTLEEIIENPHRYGLPTLEEFCKNPTLWMGHDEDLLAQADVGSKLINGMVTKHLYEIDGYRCDTLEEVEKVAKSQGYQLKELDFAPVLIPQAGLKTEVLVRFTTKGKKGDASRIRQRRGQVAESEGSSQ